MTGFAAITGDNAPMILHITGRLGAVDLPQWRILT